MARRAPPADRRGARPRRAAWRSATWTSLGSPGTASTGRRSPTCPGSPRSPRPGLRRGPGRAGGRASGRPSRGRRPGRRRRRCSTCSTGRPCRRAGGAWRSPSTSGRPTAPSPTLTRTGGRPSPNGCPHGSGPSSARPDRLRLGGSPRTATRRSAGHVTHRAPWVRGDARDGRPHGPSARHLPGYTPARDPELPVDRRPRSRASSPTCSTWPGGSSRARPRISTASTTSRWP